MTHGTLLGKKVLKRNKLDDTFDGNISYAYDS